MTEIALHRQGSPKWLRWDLVAVVLPSLAMANRLYFETLALWSKQHHQFFPLAFLAAAWFFYHEGSAESPMSRNRFMLARAMVSVGYIGVAIAVLGASSWLAHSTLVWLVFWWAIGKFANMSVVRILGICGLLLVTVPIPFGLDNSLTQFLQLLSSKCCSRLMDLSWMLHVPQGNIIETPSKPLFVEEACSGVDSQYALMAVAGVLLLVGQAPVWISIVTIITVPIWAILGNLLRIYSIAFGLEFIGIDLSSGTQHMILGLITFSLAAWAHWSSVQFLNYLDCRIGFGAYRGGEGESRTIASGTTNCVSTAQPLSALSVVAGATLTVFLISFSIFEQRTNWGLPKMSVETANRFPSGTDLPTNIQGLTLSGFMTTHRDRYDLMGQFSRSWSFDNQELTCRLSLDMPFRGWHPVSQCYANSGWKLLSVERIDLTNSGEPLTWPYFEARLENPFGTRAILYFCQFDQFGNPFPSLQVEGIPEVKDRWYMLKALLRQSLGSQAFREEPVTYQLQLHAMTKSGHDIPNPSSLRDVFLELRSRVYDQSLLVIREMNAE